MTNSKAIVSEVNPTTSIDGIYKDAISMAPYEDLAEACIIAVNNETYRNQLEELAFKTISRHPQSSLIRKII
jgi:hypothetical protein